jgi:hypothetical protein
VVGILYMVLYTAGGQIPIGVACRENKQRCCAPKPGINGGGRSVKSGMSMLDFPYENGTSPHEEHSNGSIRIRFEV